MEDVILQFLILSFSIFAVGKITNLFEIESFSTAVIVALVFALINVTLKPILEFVSFPITFITFGIFTFFVNGFCLLTVSKLVPKFKLKGCFTASLTALLISLVNTFILKVIN